MEKEIIPYWFYQFPEDGLPYHVFDYFEGTRSEFDAFKWDERCDHDRFIYECHTVNHDDPCPHCDGKGEILTANNNYVKCPWCE